MEEKRESVTFSTGPELLDYDNTVRIPILPQLNPPRILPPEATHVGRLEFAAKYLEKLGIVPTERNIAAFLRKIPNPFLPDEKTRPFDIHVIRRESEAMKKQIQFAELDVKRRTSAADPDDMDRLPSRQSRRHVALLTSAEAQPVLGFAQRRDPHGKKKKKKNARRVSIAPEVLQDEDHDVHDEAYDNLEHIRGLAAEDSHIPQPPLTDAGQCQRVVNEFASVFPFHLTRVPLREEQIVWLKEKLCAPEMGIASSALAQLAYWAAVGAQEFPKVAEAKSRSLSLRIAHSFRSLVPNVSTQSVHGIAIPVLLAALRATAHASLRISYLPAVIRLHGRQMFASIDDILGVLLDPARFYMQAALLKDQQVKRKLGGRVLATTSMPIQSLLGDAVSDAARRMLEGSPSLAHDLHEPQREVMASFSRSVSPTLQRRPSSRSPSRGGSRGGSRPPSRQDTAAWSPLAIRPRSKASAGSKRTGESSESGGSSAAAPAAALPPRGRHPAVSAVLETMMSSGSLASSDPSILQRLRIPDAPAPGQVLRFSTAEASMGQRVRVTVPEQPPRPPSTQSAPSRDDDMLKQTLSTKLTADQQAASLMKLSRRERHCLQAAMRHVLGLPKFTLSANYQHRIPQPQEETLTVEEARIRASTNLEQELSEQLMVDMQSLRDKTPSPPPRHKGRRASFL